MKKLANKKIAMILTALALVFVLASTVTAIGVAPASKRIDFVPGLKTTERLLILNNEHKDFRAVIYTQGELAKYMKIRESIITISKSDSQKELYFDISLPQEIGKPGPHSADIIIMELPEKLIGTEENVIVTDEKVLIMKSKEKGAFISATTAVIFQLRVDVPYSGKYAEANMLISEADAGETVTFGMQIYNFGLEKIEKAKARIEIFGPTNERLGVVESNDISIESNHEGKLFADWLADVNQGIYHAVATIDYDGKKIRLEENFDVGSQLIEIKDVGVKEFKLGEVAKFDILLENRWNEKVSVYGEMVVMDKMGGEIARFKTASMEIEPFEEDVLRAYWDTEGVSIGKYDIKVVLHYSEKTSEKLIEVDVGLDSININLPTARAVQVKGGLKRDSILVILVIVMIVINVGWFVYFKRRKR